MQSHSAKFQISLPTHVFEHLLTLAKDDHRLYRQQAEVILIDGIESAFQAREAARGRHLEEVAYAQEE